MADVDIKLSEIPEIYSFPASGKVYGIAEGIPKAAYGVNAFLDLVYRSAVGVNKFVVYNEPTRSGQVLTYPSGSSWYIYGLPYGNSVNNVVTIPFASAGKSRFDLIVASANNIFERVVGTEVTEPASPVSPPLPYGKLLASTVLVTDSSVGIAPDPLSPIYLGIYPSQEVFEGAVPRASLGYFAFIVNTTENILCQFDGTDWTYTPLHPIGNTELRLKTKGDGNTDRTLLEVGDIVEGFKDAGTYWNAALYNGGAVTDRDSYTPLVEVLLT